MPLRWKVRLVVLAVALLVVVMCTSGIRWVGRTDLEIVFVITDADTGAPVPTALAEVQPGDCFVCDRTTQDFTLKADAAGTAAKVCPDMMSFGTTGGPGCAGTFGTHLPDWRYRVVADGYAATDWTWLRAQDRQRQVRRDGGGGGETSGPGVAAPVWMIP